MLGHPKDVATSSHVKMHRIYGLSAGNLEWVVEYSPFAVPGDWTFYWTLVSHQRIRESPQRPYAAHPHQSWKGEEMVQTTTSSLVGR